MKLTESPRLNFYLQEMGVFTYEDVVLHLPRRCESFALTDISGIHLFQDKQRVVLYGKILERPRYRRFGKTSLVSFWFRTEDGRDHEIEAWNRDYLTKTIEVGQDYTLRASYDAKKHCLNLLALRKGKIPEEESIVPIYTLPSDYPDHAWRMLVKKALTQLEGKMEDIVPPSLRAKYRLLPRLEALWKCHFPKKMEDVRLGLRVLKYEEALTFSLKNQWIRKANKIIANKKRSKIDFHLVGGFVRSLPYPLTGDQKKAVREGLTDMNDPTLMYRLLQGDVGTGKTLVAAILLYGNCLRKEQGALLAPTDALARQHYETLSKMFEGFPVRVALLVGSLSAKEKSELLGRLSCGEIDIVVGTHALFSKNVQYQNLGFVIIDEQHKFGVNQRRLLCEKGGAADLLLMSATPIPRTLATSMYGDLDVSTLSEFPSSKRSVLTKIVSPKAKGLLKEVASSVGNDRRVYIVAPQIEKNAEDKNASAEEVFAQYSALFPGLVTLLHGKMSQEEKDASIEAFKHGEKPILVATSVIEVGIDVPKANLILIYSPTHFGLASLHQLRGRVGRNGEEAKCLLVYEGNDEEELDRLNVLVQSDDGFKIAEEDMKRRGPGEISGVKQSGIPEFHFVNLIEDFKMFECAKADAQAIVEDQNNPEYRKIIASTKAETESVAFA
ncbi:MAG: ATP-dependent DNA helicase RecG [Candidatus Enteromonas sp.]